MGIFIYSWIARFPWKIFRLNRSKSINLCRFLAHSYSAPDLTPHILELLNEFVYQLVCSGQLMMAKLLRNNILDKVWDRTRPFGCDTPFFPTKSNCFLSFALQIMVFKQQKWSPLNPILSVITSPPSLLDLKSADIAEQMTLLDAQLFQKIEIPEVLLWAQEQCEERSPNLTRFTEHFNKMSYWWVSDSAIHHLFCTVSQKIGISIITFFTRHVFRARSQILKQEDSKDREKHVIKFIKIMKHLRKINNYNSYLALLSALDSAPIRR